MKLLGAILLVLTLVAPAFGSEMMLDGKTFKGHIGPKEGKKKFKDDLVFKEGKFVSTACEESDGFGPAEYKSETKDGVMTFESTAKNAKGDMMVWKGKVMDKKVNADIVKKMADGKTENYWYKGQLAGHEKKAKK